LDKVQRALENVFQKHRVVFWYDAKQELRADYEALDMPGIDKVELKNNEFGVKHLLLRQNPKQKCLVYHFGPEPEDLNNWLLDVQLAHASFRTDQVAIWLSELNLGVEFFEVVQGHEDFFGSKKRLEELKATVTPEDTPRMIKVKMLAVCAGADPRTDDIMENLLGELALEKDEKYRLIERCHLDGFLWEQLERVFGYSSEVCSVEDFAIELFKSCYFLGLGEAGKLSSESIVFLKRWKNSRMHGKAFEALSNKYSEILKIEHDLQKRDLRALAEVDYFRLVEKKVLSALARKVVDRTISAGECAQYVRQRKSSHWYSEYESHYQAIDYASQFMELLGHTDLSVPSLEAGVSRYTESWHRLDFCYRKFHYHARTAGETTLLEPLAEAVDNLYSNNYLIGLNDNWQQVVDAAESWVVPDVPSQRQFYDQWVVPYLKQNQKVFVIISDAMRFEVGQELLGLIRQEDRYEAENRCLLSTLPSQTSLGMAALLPNKTLEYSDGDGSNVLVDGQSSMGTANREKILAGASKKRFKAMRAEDLMKMTRDDCRILFREHDVVYIYHNEIDATGDKRDTEGKVFEAVEDALVSLVKIMKRLASANVTNMLITADHGFIYQDRAIEESDFLGVEPAGTLIASQGRRHVLGKGLAESNSLRKFTAAQLGLAGDWEVQIPKSINRLRLKGAGSRFVHGGASLQEVVVPVLEVNKKRQSDIRTVEVDILGSEANTITSGQFAVSFYQVTTAGDKVQARTLRAGIYGDDGTLISDHHELTFDLTSENAREREMKIRFVLSRDADKFNEQEVTLRLEEQVPGTAQFTVYKTRKYLVRRSFTSDFDF
jgi:uncharacterized protein (TIGR02687 family)